MATVFVLDINGVVGEVSRRRVRNRTDGIQLPNDQVFYPNPMAPTFLQYMVQIRAPLVLWTSRMAKRKTHRECLSIKQHPLSQYAPRRGLHYIERFLPSHKTGCVAQIVFACGR